MRRGERGKKSPKDPSRNRLELNKVWRWVEMWTAEWCMLVIFLLGQTLSCSLVLCISLIGRYAWSRAAAVCTDSVFDLAWSCPALWKYIYAYYSCCEQCSSKLNPEVGQDLDERVDSQNSVLWSSWTPCFPARSLFSGTLTILLSCAEICIHIWSMSWHKSRPFIDLQLTDVCFCLQEISRVETLAKQASKRVGIWGSDACCGPSTPAFLEPAENLDFISRFVCLLLQIVSNGEIIWGMVMEIGRLYLNVSLPNGLEGRVHASEVLLPDCGLFKESMIVLSKPRQLKGW